MQRNETARRSAGVSGNGFPDRYLWGCPKQQRKAVRLTELLSACGGGGDCSVCNLQ